MVEAENEVKVVSMKWIIAKVNGGNEVQCTDLWKLDNYILELTYTIL